VGTQIPPCQESCVFIADEAWAWGNIGQQGKGHSGIGSLRFTARPSHTTVSVALSSAGVTAEELDFIINYDIKYRLGRDTGSEED